MVRFSNPQRLGYFKKPANSRHQSSATRQNCGGCTGWLGRQDSNLGMAESKSAALPLGYAPRPGRKPAALSDWHGGARTIAAPSPASNAALTPGMHKLH